MTWTFCREHFIRRRGSFRVQFSSPWMSSLPCQMSTKPIESWIWLSGKTWTYNEGREIFCRAECLKESQSSRVGLIRPLSSFIVEPSKNRLPMTKLYILLWRPHSCRVCITLESKKFDKCFRSWLWPENLGNLYCVIVTKLMLVVL